MIEVSLGTGLQSKLEDLGHNSHVSPVRVENFTCTVELLRKFLQVSSWYNALTHLLSGKV